MTESAIVVDDISKKYRLFDSPGDRMKEALHPFSKHYHREFWALKGVSFEVPRGQTFGILGRNGSGKSTLLQIIAGVLQPTSGTVKVNGRVAMLELGAGFNPEYSGRENVVFQAQVMGMSRKEIAQLVPNIETFADIGDFFDQPVKTYSSGMFVRVAFASAMSVFPDILIVDEALAVGDARFQHKCFQTFQKFLASGKTLILVSHDMNTLLRLCNAGVVLEGGQMHFIGPIPQAVNRFQLLLFGQQSSNGVAGVAVTESKEDAEIPDKNIVVPIQKGIENVSESHQEHVMPLTRHGFTDLCPTRPSYNKGETRFGDGRLQILDYAVVADGQVDPLLIPFDSELSIFIKLHFFEDVDNVAPGFGITTTDCVWVHGTNLLMQGKPLLSGRKGETMLIKFVWRPPLVGGDYFLNLGCDQIGSEQRFFLSNRRSIACLKFAGTDWCNGFVATESSFECIEQFTIEKQLVTSRS